jgi:hypothetical protein
LFQKTKVKCEKGVKREGGNGRPDHNSGEVINLEEGDGASPTPKRRRFKEVVMIDDD